MRIKQAIRHLSADEKLKELIDHHGSILLPVPPGDFESLAGSIVSQQLSTKAAATIWRRFKELLANDVRPRIILKTPVTDLRAVGLSGQKSKYLYALSEAFVQDPGAYENLHEMSDAEVIDHLTKIKGIGVWTVQMFLIFTLMREDVFPVGDLGVRRAMEKLYFGGDPQEHSVLSEMSEPWKPFRSVASLYLWKSLG